jgi:cell division FtsZ-interacting protein ZapD
MAKATPEESATAIGIIHHQRTIGRVRRISSFRVIITGGFSCKPFDITIIHSWIELPARKARQPWDSNMASSG